MDAPAIVTDPAPSAPSGTSPALSLRAAKYGQAPMSPEGEVAHIVPGAYYLTGINDKHHRDYARKA